MSETTPELPYTPARNLAADLPTAAPDAPMVVDLGWRGKRFVRGYVIVENRGPVRLRIETRRQMRARLRAEREDES